MAYFGIKSDELVGIVPATGFAIYWIDDDTGELWAREPVIGFVVTKLITYDKRSWYLHQSPMTATDVFDLEREFAIERPDGQIEFPEDCTCKSLEEAQAYSKERAEERNAAQAKREAARKAEVAQDEVDP